ncbi:MAG TPA: hypothetical protein DCE41_24280 [Cytophagales bacterium]|nr:hypothetical protein [Cytophagales bacterium]HAA21045.1 hypothetical protein [Cytophagales bacterium]HAP58788.1 hypothetical protein [Cytophagales bacterium]
MKKFIIISAAMIGMACMAFTQAPELNTYHYEGSGPAEYIIPLEELGDQALLEWNSKTWMAYHSLMIEDEAGNRLNNHWGFGVLFFDHKKTLDLSEVEGEAITITVKGNHRTTYSFSLTPVTE